ncbi:MAG: hypothetical protein RR543_05770, partial [Erysipelotrichales bacterium]
MINQLLEIFTKQQMSIKMIKRSKLHRFILSAILIIVIVGAFSTMLIPIYLHADELVKMLSFVNLGTIILTLCFVLVFILSFLSGLGFLYSSGYLDNNLNNYFVLPIKRRDLILAKVIFTYKNVMIIIGMIVIPFIILYILLADISIYFIVALILGVLLIPLFNIGICMVLIGTLMYFVNKLKNKALAKNLIYVTFFVVAFGLYMVFILGTTNYGDSNSQFAMIVALNDLMSKLKIIFFIPTTFVGILTDESFFNLLYVLAGLAILVLTYLYFEKVYLKGALGFNEGGSSVRKKRKKIEKLTTHSMSTWYFIREFKELTKTSAYFFNTLFSNILIVVIYLGMLGYSYFTSTIDPSVISGMVDKLDVPMIIIGTSIIGTFFALFNMGAATAFSRD